MLTYDELYAKMAGLKADGKTQDEAIKEVNTDALKEAVKYCNATNDFDWVKLIDGVHYSIISEDGKGGLEERHKTLKASDCFAIRKNKNSDKLPLDPFLFQMLAVFGKNAIKGWATSRKDCVKTLHIYAKYDMKQEDRYSCFTCETADSNRMLEKQLQVFAEDLYGAEAPKMLKSHVGFIVDQFVSTKDSNYDLGTISRYATGNELRLLNSIVARIRDSKNGIKSYSLDTKLDLFQKIKEGNILETIGKPEEVKPEA